MTVRRIMVRSIVTGILIAALMAHLAKVAIEFIPFSERTFPDSGNGVSMSFSIPGPWAVGLHEVTIDEINSIEATFWYPFETFSDAPPVVYPYGIKMFSTTSEVTIGTTSGRAIRNTDVPEPPGDFPTVVLSSGFGMGRKVYGWLAEHITSYGFVVIVPEHRELLDPSGIHQALVNRPMDIQRILAFLNSNNNNDRLRNMGVNIESVAVVGHSLGGYTALSVARARLNFSGFESLRSEIDLNDPINFLFDALTPYGSEMADQAGLDRVPEGLWPLWGDSKIEAVVSLAGDALMFGSEGLRPISVPLLAIGGTDDTDSPLEWGPRWAFDHVSSERRILLTLPGADHMVFTNTLHSLRRVVNWVPQDFGGVSPGSRREYQRVISHYVVAFLLTELADDYSAEEVFAAHSDSERDVLIESNGY